MIKGEIKELIPAFHLKGFEHVDKAEFIHLKLRVKRPYSVILPFICQECGTCCRKLGPSWATVDNYNVSEYLGIPVEDFIRRYVGDVFFYENIPFYQVDYDKLCPCPFLTNGNECSIYIVRPDTCRTYPLDQYGQGPKMICPAYQRIFQVLKVITRKISSIRINLSAEKLHSIRDFIEPTTKQKYLIHEKYIRTNPPGDEYRLFCKLNKIKP